MIAEVNVGDIIKRAKINELIAGAASGVFSWANIDGTDVVSGEFPIRRKAGNIDRVEPFGERFYRVFFTEPQTSASYCVLANCTTTIGNNEGFVEIVTQTDTYVDLFLRNAEGRYTNYRADTICIVVIGGAGTIAPLGQDAAITAAKVNEVIDLLNDFSLTWGNIAGTGSPAVRAGFGNINAVSRISPGYYRVTFDTARSDADYAVVASCTRVVGNDSGVVVIGALTTTYVDLYCRHDDDGGNDVVTLTLLVLGD